MALFLSSGVTDMQVTNNFKVEGLAELEKALLDLGAELGYKTLRTAGRKAMKPVLDSAIAGANEETGDLKAAHAISAKKGRGARGKGGDTAVEIHVGPTRRSVVQKGADGSKSRNKLAGVSQKAIAQEFGTANQQAEPFLRPALSQNADKVLSQFSKELATAIDKAAKKVAKQ